MRETISRHYRKDELPETRPVSLPTPAVSTPRLPLRCTRQVAKSGVAEFFCGSADFVRGIPWRSAEAEPPPNFFFEAAACRVLPQAYFFFFFWSFFNFFVCSFFWSAPVFSGEKSAAKLRRRTSSAMGGLSLADNTSPLKSSRAITTPRAPPCLSNQGGVAGGAGFG